MYGATMGPQAGGDGVGDGSRGWWKGGINIYNIILYSLTFISKKCFEINVCSGFGGLGPS